MASREVVGSSAISTAGLHEIPIAPTTRCLIPPESWWGKSFIRVSGAGIRTFLSISTTVSLSPSPLRPSWICRASPTWSSISNTGLSAVIGSCKTMAMREPLTFSISFSLRSRMFSPSRMTSPPTMCPGGDGTSLIIERVVTDFPEPDSPTIPSVSPLRRLKLTPSTALTTPHRVTK